MSTKLAITLGQKAQWCDQRWQLKLTRETALLKIDLDLERQRHLIDNQARDRQIELLTESLKKGQPFYLAPWFLVPVTFLVTTGFMVCAIKGAALLH